MKFKEGDRVRIIEGIEPEYSGKIGTIKEVDTDDDGDVNEYIIDLEHDSGVEFQPDEVLPLTPEIDEDGNLYYR